MEAGGSGVQGQVQVLREFEVAGQVRPYLKTEGTKLSLPNVLHYKK